MDISYGGGNCVYLLPANPEVAVSYIQNRNVIGRRVSAGRLTRNKDLLLLPLPYNALKTQSNIQTYFALTLPFYDRIFAFAADPNFLWRFYTVPSLKM